MGQRCVGSGKGMIHPMTEKLAKVFPDMTEAQRFELTRILTAQIALEVRVALGQTDSLFMQSVLVSS